MRRTEQRNGPRASLSMAALERLLRERGGRSTRQRRALYRALAGRTDHPTAEELHREVRRSIPSLSLATVYTSLDALVRAGAAARIVHADGLAHFDARTDPHGHRRCGRCGRVEDVEIPHRPERIADIPLGDFTLTGFHIELFGTCADCDRSGGARSEP